MEKKILKELQNITKELKVIGKNIKAEENSLPMHLIRPLLDEGQMKKLNNAKEVEDLIYDTEVAIEFIQTKFKEEGLTEVTKEVISKMIDYEEDYMRSVGIIKD